ncbi:hypothetical protein I79_014241 [Cricetulus griseus]|uniref:Uncharacterized protein n=1 Tax=Cricetulus griseus TaxID=10029 RepID=G3HTL3_CRIGR|nr:hypothetical protein I79_014241 [Cricetulus griseus]
MLGNSRGRPLEQRTKKELPTEPPVQEMPCRLVLPCSETIFHFEGFKYDLKIWGITERNSATYRSKERRPC